MSVEKRAADVFVARIRTADGKSRQRTFKTLSEARRWEREQRVAVTRGDFIDTAAGSIRFADYVTDWLDTASLRWRASTERETRRRVTRHLVPEYGDRPLRSITTSHIQAHVSRLAETLKPNTVRNVLQSMRAVMDTAVADRLIITNPCDRVILPKVEPVPVTPLSAFEVDTIAEMIRPDLRAFVILGAASGLRSGELRALTVGDFSPALHVHTGHVGPVTIRVRRGVDDAGHVGPPKSPSANRDVVIPASVARQVADHLDRFGVGDDGLVFHHRGRIWPLATLATAWKAATPGYPRGHGPHSLRHHHASTLLAAGVNIAAVSRRLGHSSPVITLRAYSHEMRGDHDAILRVLEG
jgi:integrase